MLSTQLCYRLMSNRVGRDGKDVPSTYCVVIVMHRVFQVQVNVLTML